MTLRTYAPMRRVSRRRQQGQDEWQAVYRQVDQRSEGRCEVWLDGQRCPKRAREHHHLVKPRASHHEPALIVHMCRDHHDRCEWPYQRGRLVPRLQLLERLYTSRPMRGMQFEVVYVSEKRRT